MKDEFKAFLEQLITFESISSDKTKLESSRKTAEFIIDNFENIGVHTQLVENEIDDKNPLVFGRLGEDPHKKTILFYSHYDVQPAEIEDGWDTNPFVLTEKEDGYFYGRGTDDDKGPIAATFFAIKDLIDESVIPVNIRFLYEGEEESGSEGFKETVRKNRDFFGNIDGILIMDASWFNDNRPSMDYGLRGIAYMAIAITGPKKDQHSGQVGGTIHEPMTNLIHVMSRLIDVDGRILINGFYDNVKPLTEEERRLYDNLEFSLTEYKKSLGIEGVLIEDAQQTLMNMWRNPALSIHGIEGAFGGPGAKTVVPGTVTGKVSMRLVPDQNPQEISELFTNYVLKEFKKLNSPNKINISPLGIGDWWYGDIDNFLFESGKAAMKEYWKMDPSFARSGGSIPIVPFMEKIFDAPAMGLGIGQSSDGAHSQNERIRIENLVGGKEIIKLILKEISD